MKERAARRRVASLQSELRDQCGVLCEDGPLAVADALFDGERVEWCRRRHLGQGLRLLALVWLGAPGWRPGGLPEAPSDASGDLVALYGPPPPPPSSAARAGELAFDLGVGVRPGRLPRGLRESSGGWAPPWPDQAFQRMPLPRSPSPSPPSSPVDDVSPPPGRRAVALSVAAAVTRDARVVAPGEDAQVVVTAAVVAPENAAGSRDARCLARGRRPAGGAPEFAVDPSEAVRKAKGNGHWCCGQGRGRALRHHDDDDDEEFGVEAARARGDGRRRRPAPLPAPQDELRRSTRREGAEERGHRAAKTQT